MSGEWEGRSRGTLSRSLRFGPLWAEVLTAEAYPDMIQRATEWTEGFRLHSTNLACRGRSPSWERERNIAFFPTPPKDGAEAADADDF